METVARETRRRKKLLVSVLLLSALATVKGIADTRSMNDENRDLQCREQDRRGRDCLAVPS